MTKKMGLIEAQDLFRECIDDTSEPVKVLGYEYPASTVLEEVDPIAFRTALHDWADSQDIEIV